MAHSGKAAFILIALTACGGGTPEIASSNAPPPAPRGVHYLDDTGCQDFPSSDFWNRPTDSARVASHSGAKIAYAYSQYSGAPTFNEHYTYEVVPAGAALYAVKSNSTHAIPANYQRPQLHGWPIPRDMQTLLSTTDNVSILVQTTSPPSTCRGWNGYGFTGSGVSYSAYSGDHVEMSEVMPPETCNGTASLCGEDLEGDLTYYELNANTANAPGIVTSPISHAIHTELPCSIAGTCGRASSSAFNAGADCRTSCARIRLRAGALPRPSDPNAAALYDAMVHYGLDTSESGCCWGFYTMLRARDSGYPQAIPPAVSSFIAALRLKDFEVLANGTW